MRPYPCIAARQCGVFSARQAFAEGWTKAELAYAARTGRLVRLRPGAYRIVDLRAAYPELGPFDVARWMHAGPGVGAALVTSAAFASHSTAAVLHGLPLLFVPARPCLTVPPTITGEIARVHLHRCTIHAETCRSGHVRSLDVARTVLDLAREHGVTAGVVAADSALHQKQTTLGRLLSVLEQCHGWPGVRSARDTLALADGRSESVLESRSRLLLREWGLPAPEPQVRIGNAWGGFVARVDFYWDEFGVVGEVDGAIKYDGSDARALHEEKKRQETLEQDLELPVVRWGNAELRDFGAVAARLRRRFAQRQGLPRTARRWTVLPPL